MSGAGSLLRRAVRPGEVASPAQSWRIALSTALTVVGLGLAIYLTIGHYEGPKFLDCTDSGLINCYLVTTSAQSYVFGIPVAVLGLAYYTVMAVVNSPWAWRARDRRVHVARLVLAVAGMCFVLYLISAELLIIKAICIYCTGVHIVTFAQLILVVATVPTMLGVGQAPARPPSGGRRPPLAADGGRAGGHPNGANGRTARTNGSGGRVRAPAKRR